MLSLSLAERQLRDGRHFLFEHPLTAKSWIEPCLIQLKRRPNVVSTECDQCMYGCVAMGAGGEYTPARKSTRFLTSSPLMAQRLSTKCDKSHSHVPLLGKNLSEASFYPVQLRLSILRGMRDQADAEDCKKWPRPFVQQSDDPELEASTMRASQFQDDISMSIASIVAEAHRRKEEIPRVAKFKFKKLIFEAI